MLRRILWIWFVLALSFSCTKDCYEDKGEIITRDIEVAPFANLIVNSGVEVHIKQGDTPHISVEIDKNKWDNFHYQVTGETLELRADSPCPLHPSFDPVRVYITVPNLKTIRNSSEYTLVSDGVLTFPHLSLLSENFQNAYFNVGGFDFEINNMSLSVASNGLAVMHLRGKTRKLELFYYAGIGRFEGKDLQAETVYIYHKGNNTLHVYPIAKIKGAIYANGDVISYNKPPLVEVKAYFKGQLYFTNDGE